MDGKETKRMLVILKIFSLILSKLSQKEIILGILIEAYSEPCQISKIKFSLRKYSTAFNRYLFLQKALSYMFEVVLNLPLVKFMWQKLHSKQEKEEFYLVSVSILASNKRTLRNQSTAYDEVFLRK